MHRIGASGKINDVYAKFEISVDALVRTARDLIGSDRNGKSGYPVE